MYVNVFKILTLVVTFEITVIVIPQNLCYIRMQIRIICMYVNVFKILTLAVTFEITVQSINEIIHGKGYTEGIPMLYQSLRQLVLFSLPVTRITI
jgi:hypothetical protein